jgi:hypothetical protein
MRVAKKGLLGGLAASLVLAGLWAHSHFARTTVTLIKGGER